MRSITLALVVAFATATRLTAVDATLAKTDAPKTADVKQPHIGDIKPIDKPIEKPLDIKAPGEVKKEETLEDSKEKGSNSVGVCAQSQIVCQEYQAVPAPVCPAFADLDCSCALPCQALGSA